MERNEVEWNRANCLGIDTEIFFKQQSELLPDGMSFLTLRRICFNCPIWKECLEIAMREETYGFWGGLSETERAQIYKSKHDRRFVGLQRDLKFFPHIQLSEIIKIIRSVKRPYGNSGTTIVRK